MKKQLVCMDNCLATRIPDELSGKMYNMSALSALLIVLLHTPLNYMEMPTWCIRYIRFGLCEIAVPYFFFASGFFLMGTYCTRGGLHNAWIYALKTRFWTLVVPYLIFETIAGLVKHEWGYGISLLRFPAYHLLWYVRTLFLFVVISILIAALIRRSKWFSLFTLILVFVFSCLWVELSDRWCHMETLRNLFDITIRPVALFMFMMGMFLRFYRLDLLASKYLRYFMLLGITLLMARTSLTGAVAITGVCLLMFGILGCISHVVMPAWIVRNAFPIYLLHGLLIYGARSVMRRSGYEFEAKTVILYFIMAISETIVCIAVAQLLRRFMPRVSNIAFGGR